MTGTPLALLDYGAGNLTSVRKGFAAAGARVFRPTAPAELAGAAGLVIPGVGHFGATAALDEAWRGAVRAAVSAGTPLLGICLGLQLLFEGSDEAPDVEGLSFLCGRCRRLPAGRKIPHVGWNSLALSRSSRLFDGIDDGTQVYFTHSYAAPLVDETAAVAIYGTAFSAAIEKDPVFGVQFHPEKSGPAGIAVLRNFVALARQR